MKRGGGTASAIGTNEGQLRLTKEVDGDAVLAADTSYSFRIDAFDENGTLLGTEDTTLTAGETYATARYLRGTRLVVTETTPDSPGSIEWRTSYQDDAAHATSSTSVYEVVLSDENHNLGVVSPLTVTNTATLEKTQFRASKNVENPGEVMLPADAVFLLDYHYPADAAQGIPEGSGTLELPADGTVVTSDDIPVGAHVSLSERTPMAVAGGRWEQPAVSPASFVATPAAEEPLTVTVTNTLTPLVGTFRVAKTMAGNAVDSVDPHATYTIAYAYDAGEGFAAGSGTLRVAADGVPVTSPDLPAGAVVRLSETLPADTASVHWRAPVFSAASVTIVADETTDIRVTNTAETPPSTPIEPSSPPTEPSAPPVEPSTPPSEPSAPPVEPSSPPVEPSTPPVEPSAPSAEPSTPPVDPSAPATPPVSPSPATSTPPSIAPSASPSPVPSPAPTTSPETDGLATTGGTVDTAAALFAVVLLAGGGLLVARRRRRT